MTQEYEFHPIADAFPIMQGDEYQELVEDIRKNGLNERIVLHEGKILDGRNRYRACLEAGVEASTKEFLTDRDPFDYVITKNLCRRHLTTKQRSAIAADLATMKQGTRTDLPSKDGKSAGMSTKQAAKAMKVSESSVERRKKVKRENPAEHERAKRGEPKAEPKAKAKTSKSQAKQDAGLAGWVENSARMEHAMFIQCWLGLKEDSEKRQQFLEDIKAIHETLGKVILEVSKTAEQQVAG